MRSAVRQTLVRASAAGALVALAYAVVGFAIYVRTFGIFFMSDDFEFLSIVAPAKNVLVIFEPLVGRFVRPLVVLMYYVNYHTIGLAPWGYHLSTVMAHLVGAWLVYLVARRLGRAERDEHDTPIWAFLAGLLFLVFSGHSEAVSWPAGIADPVLTVFLLTAFLCYLRALEPGASWGWLAAMFGAVLMATQAKEMWVVFPGILVLHAAALGLPGPAARKRATIAVGGTAVLALAYLVMRHLVFGSVAGGYSGLGSSIQSGIFVQQARAFVLRAFVPASGRLGQFWLSRGDLILWPLAALVLAWVARGRTLRVLIFSALALVASLVPVLPLTISLTSTESERFVYLPSVFSCIFLVWAIKATIRYRPAAIACCVAAIAVHSVALVRANGKWQESGALTRSIVDSFAQRVLEQGSTKPAGIFILNLPDNVRGAYVFRNGFYPAVRLVRPETASFSAATFGLATQSLGAFADDETVQRTGARGFRVNLGSNRLIQPQIPSNGLYRIVEQTPSSYAVEFSESISTALVLYLTQGRLESAGTVTGPGVPFGLVDIPADGAACAGESIRFAGWALDDVGVAGVKLSAVDEAGNPAAPVRVLGEASWKPGDRPDVAQRFPGYPNADRASWDFRVACETVARSAQGMIRIRVVAYDGKGQEAVIGERVVRATK